MSLKLDKYLKELKKNKNHFEGKDINGEEEKNVLKKYFRNIVSVSISVFIVFALSDGFNKDFISYVTTVLSILIGLFTTAIIFSFDKFYIPLDRNRREYDIFIKHGDKVKNKKISFNEISQQNSEEKIKEKQSYNYYVQFANIIGYNIVLCVYVLLLLFFNSLFYEYMDKNIFEYELNIQNITFTSIKAFVILLIIVLYRFFVLYWILNVMYNTLYAISSMVNFMTKKR